MGTLLWGVGTFSSAIIEPRFHLIDYSAGVGRTGTFITIESMMQQGKEEGQVNVFKFVSDMRQNRMQMIQTEVKHFYNLEKGRLMFMLG